MLALAVIFLYGTMQIMTHDMATNWLTYSMISQAQNQISILFHWIKGWHLVYNIGVNKGPGNLPNQHTEAQTQDSFM